MDLGEIEYGELERYGAVSVKDGSFGDIVRWVGDTVRWEM
jgi:hypothetical protein